MYKRVISICIVAGMLAFSILFGKAMLPEKHPVNSLARYLDEKSSNEPYAYAQIRIVSPYISPYAEGTAEISWKFFQTAEEFEAYFFAKEEEDTAFEGNEECIAEFVYYRYQLEEGIHALDLYHSIKDRYDEEDSSLHAYKASTGIKGYYFQWPSDEVDRIIIVNEGALYGIEREGVIDSEFYGDFAHKLLNRFALRILKAQDFSGWMLSEEDLYWIDHEERKTRLENPDRTFLEVRGIDACWRGQALKENFAMFKEADYKIRLCEEESFIQIHFRFAEEIPETGYREYLFNGFCTDKDYEMTVKNFETGEVYQQQNVPLSIELPDMISFVDLDVDGYLDMQVERPVHSSGERAVIEEYQGPYYMLWNPEESIFEIKGEHEISRRLFQNQRQKADETEYVVQPGDTLWGIAKEFYGFGSWYERIEKENEEILSQEKYLMPGVTIKISR